MQICGIYAIENLINGKVYIGQSVDIKKRFREHKYHFKTNNHCNNYLQNAWNKYGEENFSFEIIEQCSEEELRPKEIFYIEEYRKIIEVYNLTNGGDGTKGYNHTEESKKKMSEYHKGKHEGENNNFYGKKHTKETKEKISKVCKGKPGTMTGRAHTEYSKKKMSKSRKGILTWNKGIPHTEETKEKISLANKGKPSPMKGKPSWNKGKTLSKETRKKMSEAAKKREEMKKRSTIN